MEGDGGGMMAILQGTMNAGLRVTLVPDNCPHSKRKCVLMDLGTMSPTHTIQSSVETNTEKVFQNANVPMYDVRYASNYQFANCKAIQSSFRVTNFPQHRTFYNHTDHFTNSLRKYPVQASSEILQRIINYSNIIKNTRKQNLRSIRSLLRKSTSQQMNRRYENGVNTNNEIYERRSLNKSIPSIGKKYSSQKELLNYTYDYLKCMSLMPRSTDVRYFTQVKNYIRNRLLDIIDDRPVICPRIRSRYSRHKKHFHGSLARPVLTSNRNEILDSSGTNQFTDMVCKNSSFSRPHSCFCRKPKKCNCTPKLYQQNPLESLIRKLYPELKVNKKEIPSKQIVLEPKIQEPENVTIEPYVGMDDKIMTAVLEWLKLIPVYPNFSDNDKIKQEELAFRLAENLSSLKNDVDFISKAKKEIMSCVNDLPMWYPPTLNEKKQFINQIVADLLKRLADILDSELRYKVAQVFSNLSNTENIDTEKFVDDFVREIKTTVLHPPEDEGDYIQALKPRILDLLKKCPIQLTNEKMDDVADKLVNQLLQLRKVGEEGIPVDENTFKENILKWLKNVPELEGIDFAQNMDLIDVLANQFKDYKSRGSKDESLQGELVKAIRDWLEDVADSVDLRLNSKTKNRLSNKMANHFFGKDNNNSLNKRKEESEISSSQEALKPLLKWYSGIQKLVGGERADTRKDIDRLAKELNDIQSRDYSFENMLKGMKEVVTDWLQNMLKKESKHLSSKDLDNCVNELISELNVVPKRKKHSGGGGGEYGQFYRDIVSWIKNIPYLKPGSHLILTKEIEQIVNKLNNIRKGSDLESTINKAVTKFIQSLSESLRVSINEEDIQVLKDILFERLKHRVKQRKRWEKENDLCQSILSEFSNTLRAYSDILGDTKVISNKFYRKFLENIEENVLPNWNYLRRQLNNIFMEETTLPKQECEDLANSIITRLQKMFPLEITRRSTILSQPVKTYVEPPKMKENILDATQKHRPQKYSNDPESTSAQKNTKRKHQSKTNLQAGDGRKYRKNSKTSTIYKTSNSDLDTHDSLDYYDNNYETSEKQNDQSAFYKHEEHPTSTHLSTPIKHFPTALDVGSSIENLTSDSKITHDSKLSKQSQYLTVLKDVITDWIKSIGLSTNNLDLDSVVDSIASDIIDRQKYLQLSKTKYSENDELEHLKYQIFRKLNKFKKADILPHIMSKINSLHCLIKNISIPDLIKPVNQSQPTTSMSHNSIFNKISHWLDRVPTSLLKSKDIKQNPALLNKLVHDLKNIKKNSQYDYEIEKYILEFLQNALKKCNDNIFHELAEDLKSSLQDTVVKTSSILKEDTSELIYENISLEIVAWLRNAQFYNFCTSEKQDLQEKLALLLATNLRNILQTPKNEAGNENDQLIEEVQKYLKTIPIPIEFRNNKYYYKAAGELVEHLKPTINKIKEMIDDSNDISSTYEETNAQNDFVDYNDLIKNIINNWCDNLPIHLGHSFESKEQAKKLKQNIAMGLLEKLSDINRKESDNDISFEIKLSDEIHKIFLNVPMNRELERSVPILKSILIDKLKQAKIQTQNLEAKKVLQDTLTKTLQEMGNTLELEQPSLDLLKEKLADAFINLHYHASTDEFRDKFKDKLYNEIDKFCNAYLERVPFSPIDSDELGYNLYELLKKIPKPDMQQHPDISEVASKSSFQKEVPLKYETTKYSSPKFLSSTLSNDDKAHLEIIRQRTASYTESIKSKLLHKDSSPHLKDKGVVTDWKRKDDEKVKFKDIGVLTDSKEIVEKIVQTSGTLLPETISHSKEILPQVVIKEFYWDSIGSKHNFKMFVPPALTPIKTIHRKIDTNNTHNETGTNLINNSTKVNVSQQLPDTRKGSNNKADTASGATSHNNKKQEHYTSTYLNAPVQKSQNSQTLMFSKESTHGQSQTEKPFHQYRRKRDTDTAFDNGGHERYWNEPPRNIDDGRYIRKDHRQPNNLEDFFNTPNDRRMLTKRMFWSSDNRNKECMMCNYNTNCRMDGRTCDTLKYCSKCCGRYCPHPTMAFFKKTF